MRIALLMLAACGGPPPFHVHLADAVEDQTVSPPSCGCAEGSLAAQILGYFDTQPDCTITNDEVNATAFFDGDDVALGGPWDGGVSFGIQLSAVAASF